jgi:hypothetical protein
MDLALARSVVIPYWTAPCSSVHISLMKAEILLWTVWRVSSVYHCNSFPYFWHKKHVQGQISNEYSPIFILLRVIMTICVTTVSSEMCLSKLNWFNNDGLGTPIRMTIFSTKNHVSLEMENYKYWKNSVPGKDENDVSGWIKTVLISTNSTLPNCNTVMSHKSRFTPKCWLLL